MQKNTLGKNELELMAKGACLLGSGGGGTLDSAWNFVQHFTESDYYGSKTPTFTVIDLKVAVKAGGYGVVIAYLGAPEALKSTNYPEGVVHAVRKIKEELEKNNDKLEPDQRKFLRYIIPAEIGALSSVIPCLVASKLNLEVIDGDGAGRAVPELPMLTYAAEKISVNPIVLSNNDGYAVMLDVSNEKSTISDAEAAENLTRAVVGLKEFNQIAGLATWVMGPQEMARAVQIRGTLTETLETGYEVLQQNASEIIKYLNRNCPVGKEIAFNIFEGVFFTEGCKTQTIGGFDRGTITIINSKDEIFSGIFQNETLLAWKSSETSPLAMAPDSIAYYVEDEQKVYSNGDMLEQDGMLLEKLKNKNVTVIGIAARDVLRKINNKKLDTASFSDNEGSSIMYYFRKALLSLGYAGNYIPIEKIWRHTK